MRVPLDGIAMAREIRVRYPGLPVLLTSDHASEMPRPTEFMLLAEPCRLTRECAQSGLVVRQLP